jgi:hypothetical protein
VAAVVERVREAALRRDPTTGRPGDPNTNSLRMFHRPELHADDPAGFVTLMELAASPVLIDTVAELLGACRRKISSSPSLSPSPCLVPVFWPELRERTGTTGSGWGSGSWFVLFSDRLLGEAPFFRDAYLWTNPAHARSSD